MAVALTNKQHGAVPDAAPYLSVVLHGDPMGKADHGVRIIENPEWRRNEPWARARKRIRQYIPILYLEPETRKYMEALALAARTTMARNNLTKLDCAVAVGVLATMRIPRSWSEREQADALSGIIIPTAKPDWDNIAKMLDAFNDVVWTDDARVAQGTVVKQYGLKPSLRIEVFRLMPRAPLFDR